MKRILFSVLMLACVVGANAQQTAKVGKSVTAVRILDSNGTPKNIPFIGSKVVTIFYTDPDVKDVNDPLSDALKAKNFSKDQYAGIGIANCKDTWLPNSAIKMKAREKEKQFPGSVVMIDESNVVSIAWGLGVCDGAGVVVVVGKDSKIKFVKTIKSQNDSRAAIQTVLKIIQDEMAK